MLEKRMSADGKVYHEECFSCSHCHERISGSYFKDETTKKGGRTSLLCPGCHEVKNPPTFCAGCQGRVNGQFTVVGKQTFHNHCFTCCRCSDIIPGTFFRADDGFLCCECQPRCAGCKEGLAERSTLTVDGKRYHEECFKCYTCASVLTGSHYEVRTGWGLYRCQPCQKTFWQAEEDAKNWQSSTIQRQLVKRNTEEFNLYWRPELEPCSLKALQAMGVPQAQLPHSRLVCLCFDKKSGHVSCAPLGPKCDPKAAVNLSYFATSLQILTRCGREASFSLDGKDRHDMAGETLVKRFYPSWLASTVVGEVLFQADYALKEMCFGEHAQALPWCADIFEGIAGRDDAIAARQWFTLRSAVVMIGADGAVVPKVKMGVEARRLVKGKNGYEDAPHTAPDDPYVKQAALVTSHFAEVSSHLPVVGELFELARAMVAAKFLLEQGCQCEVAALESYETPQTPEGESCALEIPTLRKDRRNSKIVCESGGLVLRSLQRAMNGGVDLSVPTSKVQAKSDSTRRLATGKARTLLPLFVQPHVAGGA